MILRVLSLRASTGGVFVIFEFNRDVGHRLIAAFGAQIKQVRVLPSRLST